MEEGLKEIISLLQSARDARQKLDADLALLQQLRARAESVAGVQYDRVSVCGGADEGPALERAALSIVDLEHDIERDVKRWHGAINLVRSIVLSVDDPRYRDILDHRYLRAEKWDAVCESVGYSWQHALTLHREALQEVKGLIESDRIRPC